jgi:hypothetical protein
MKDATEYLAIVVIACAAGYWLLNELGMPAMAILNQTARMITGGL